MEQRLVARARGEGVDAAAGVLFLGAPASRRLVWMSRRNAGHFRGKGRRARHRLSWHLFWLSLLLKPQFYNQMSQLQLRLGNKANYCLTCLRASVHLIFQIY